MDELDFDFSNYIRSADPYTTWDCGPVTVKVINATYEADFIPNPETGEEQKSVKLIIEALDGHQAGTLNTIPLRVKGYDLPSRHSNDAKRPSEVARRILGKIAAAAGLYNVRIPKEFIGSVFVVTVAYNTVTSDDGTTRRFIRLNNPMASSGQLLPLREPTPEGMHPAEAALARGPAVVPQQRAAVSTQQRPADVRPAPVPQLQTLTAPPSIGPSTQSSAPRPPSGNGNGIAAHGSNPGNSAPPRRPAWMQRQA
jgi:hypothetical protein